jgi:DNA polymerase-2
VPARDAPRDDGRRKRYAGLVDDGDGPRVVFTGMEAVRSDWTELAKEVQRELYARLFADQPVEPYLRDVVARMRAGELDDRLVYRKALRKRPEAYTATPAPRRRGPDAGPRERGRIAYVITTAGPQPAARRQRPSTTRTTSTSRWARWRSRAHPAGPRPGSVLGTAKQLRLF